ncbi:MAG: head-tail connector protein [Methylocystis sp.]|uniref:head-tail connector protein n=1 Tax=Methylocystis sp. TaxID=1911079 RepID=UPI003DA37167
MRPMLIAAPTLEPVSIAEMKSWLREDSSDEDQLIQALIASARMTLEAYTRRFFITQSWRIIFDAWPPGGDVIVIPFAPFQTVSAIRIYDASDVALALAPTSYRAPASSEEGRLIFRSAPPAPGRSADGVEIDFAVGYGGLATNVPEPLRRAIMMLVAHWREKRGDDANDPLPAAAAQLAAPFRRWRLN